MNLIAFGGMLLNIVLNLLMIPVYQATGSAIASLFTQILVALLQVWVVKRLFGLSANYSFLSRLVIYAAGVLSIGFVSGFASFSWQINIMILGVGSLALALAVKLISLRHIYQLIRFREG